MERNREVRRASIVGSNGFNRRRHRTNMLRDSTDEDDGVELQESVRLKERTKKDRDRERERERERDLRERLSRSKRRRGERLISNRDDIGDDTSDESLNDDDDDEDATATRLVPPSTAAPAAISNHTHHSSHSQQHSSNYMNSVNHHLQHRKSFPPASSSSSSKNFRAGPSWKPDEIINVCVPRKARSASTKRLHDWASNSSNNNSGGGGEKVNRQPSTSPARRGGVSTSTPSPAAPMSPPSSSNTPFRKKLKSGGSNGGLKLKPPKAAAKQSSSNPEELEIEIAEVLYGLMTQSQGPSSKKEDSREVNRSSGDGSSPISNSDSANKQILGPNSSPLQAVAPKRKRPRPIPENSISGGSAKLDKNQTVKSEISSPNSEKITPSNGENSSETGVKSTSQGPPAAPPPPETKMDSELKAVAEQLKEKKSTAVRNGDNICMDKIMTETASAGSTMIKADVTVGGVENRRHQKLEIDLMAPPPQIRSPEREIKIHLRTTTTCADTELEPNVLKDEEDEKRKIEKKQSENVSLEAGLKKETENKGENVVLQLDLEKSSRNGNAGVNKHIDKQQEVQFKANREEPLLEKSGQSKGSLALPMPSMASWPCGLPPMGYMAPLQGVVSMEGAPVAPTPIQPLFSQPRPKRCATHSYIAKSIHCLQQVMKMNPFWHMAANSASFFGSKPDLNTTVRSVDNALDKGNDVSTYPSHGGREKASQTATKQQQILMQQPVAAPNLLGPAFIFPFNQQQTASARPSSTKSSTPAASDPSGVSFNFPAMAANETQYLAILQNNAYPYPIAGVGAPPGYRNPAPFTAPFYSSQMIHPSQLQQQAHSNTTTSSQKHLIGQQQPASKSTASHQPIHPHNFSLISPPHASGSSGNQSEKKQQQQQHGFAMSFGTMNGANSDLTSMAQNHAMQMMAQSQKKHLRLSEDEKSEPNLANPTASSAQTSAVTNVNVVESSGRAPHIASVTARSSRPATGSAVNMNPSSVNRSKAVGASNGSLFSDHLNSSPLMAAKFQPGFSPSPAQSPQWRSSTQHAQSQMQTQISFGGQNSNRISSPPVVVGSPATSSMSRASGSPRAAASAATNPKLAQISPSILGQPSSSSGGAKNPHQKQSQPPPPAMAMQQAQLFISSPYSQAQSSSTTTSPGVFYMQRRWPEQQQQPSTTMNDPAKAIAAATANGLPATLLPGGFSYPHQAPAAVQVKPAEQKQPAG